MHDAIIDIKGLSKSFGGVLAIDALSLSIRRGRLTGIIGANGAGKTTLLNLICGVFEASSGSIHVDGQDISGLKPHELAQRGITRSFQNLQIFGDMTALENVLIAVQSRYLKNYLRLVLPLKSVRADEKKWHSDALQWLALVGLESVADREAKSLPYGLLKRLELARAIALEPKCILLDEPAAGCNSTEANKLMDVIRSIAGRGVTVVLVEHNMKVVMNLCEEVFVLDRGRLLCSGTPDTVGSDLRVVSAYLGSTNWDEAK